MGTTGLQFPSVDNAIAKFEGFGIPGSVATRTNNPGNIAAGDFATQHGAIGNQNGFAVFQDPTSGTAAEDALVSLYAQKGASISDLISSWSPATAPGNTAQGTQNYIDYVSSALGVPSNTPLSSVSGGATPPIASSTSAPTQNVWQRILNGFTGGASLLKDPNALAGAITGTAASGLQTSTGFSYGRIGAFLLGFILIVGGIYLFKPVQEVVHATARNAVKAAVL